MQFMARAMGTAADVARFKKVGMMTLEEVH
jgi:hypothetical protein